MGVELHMQALLLFIYIIINGDVGIYMFLMRDERKKQARSNKQTRQSNTAHMYVLGVAK